MTKSSHSSTSPSGSVASNLHPDAAAPAMTDAVVQDDARLHEHENQHHQNGMANAASTVA